MLVICSWSIIVSQMRKLYKEEDNAKFTHCTSHSVQMFIPFKKSISGLCSPTQNSFMSFKQTFLRQKVFLASSGPDTVSEKEEQKTSGCNSCLQNVEMDKTDIKTGHACSRLNVNCNAVGALRYALHLRFVCPSSKKSSTKYDPSLSLERNQLDSDGQQRRFYLYDDLKVVFPQRHSDADEGKVSDFIYLIISQYDLK